MSGEIRPEDWANVRASAIAPTNHNHRRDASSAVEHETDDAVPDLDWLATVAVLDPVEH